MNKFKKPIAGVNYEPIIIQSLGGKCQYRLKKEIEESCGGLQNLHIYELCLIMIKCVFVSIIDCLLKRSNPGSRFTLIETLVLI